MQNTSTNPDAVRDELQAWCDQGWQHLEAGDLQAACQAFRQSIESGAEQAIAGAALGGVRGVLLEAVAGLGRCLAEENEETPIPRQDALQSLFQAFHADVLCGADGLAKEASFTLLRHAGGEECAALSTSLRRELIATHDTSAAEHYWRLLLDVEALNSASLDDVLARVCKAGYPALAVEKLLDLDRVGEALILARKELRSTEALLRLADSPAARGQMPAVAALIEERLARSFDPDLAEWLANRYAERGDLPRALDLRLRLLRMDPSEVESEAVQELARRVGRWEQLRPQVEKVLQRRRR